MTSKKTFLVATILRLDGNLEKLGSEIIKRIAPLRKDMAIIISVPGIGFISAAVILAEIGNYNDFDKAEQLAAWCGPVPSVYQSADKIFIKTEVGPPPLRPVGKG